MSIRIITIGLILLMLPTVNAQAPEVVEEDNTEYYGFEYGAAGILQVLLEYYQENSSILPVITHGLDALWKKRNTENISQAIWEKSDGTGFYPGLKYGNAGIIKTYVSAYKILKNQSYLDHAVVSVDTIYSHAMNASYPHWSYTYYKPEENQNGIVITDLRYGSLGLIDAFLDIYEVTNSSRFLSMAVNATRYLITTANNYTINDQTFPVLSWYVHKTIINEITALLHGNTGLLRILPRLYELSKNEYYLNWSRFICEWLVLNQNSDGAWNYNINEGEIEITSYSLGTLGIIYELSQYGGYDESVKDALSWINYQVIQNSTHLFLPEYPEEQYGWTSLYRGLSGLLYTYSSIFDSLDSGSKSILLDMYTWLCEEALIPTIYKDYTIWGIIPRSNYKGYIDLSYGDGIAGILHMLLNLNHSFTQTNNINVDSIITKLCSSLILTQNENGLWPKQILVNIPNSSKKKSYVVLLGLASVFLMILIILKYKNKA